MTSQHLLAADLLVADRTGQLHREAASIRVARLVELARTCCAAVQPSRITRTLSGIRLAFAGR
jgi:hypothetical protein